MPICFAGANNMNTNLVEANNYKLPVTRVPHLSSISSRKAYLYNRISNHTVCTIFT